MNWCDLRRQAPRSLTQRGQKREDWDLTGFWKLTERFRGSRQETLDVGRKKNTEEDEFCFVFIYTRSKPMRRGCHTSSVTVALRTMTGFSSNHDSLWLTACSFFCSYNPEKRRSVSADSCREQGRENGRIVRLSWLCPACLSAAIHLKCMFFFCALISSWNVQPWPPCQPGFVFFFILQMKWGQIY